MPDSKIFEERLADAEANILVLTSIMEKQNANIGILLKINETSTQAIGDLLESVKILRGLK